MEKLVYITISILFCVANLGHSIEIITENGFPKIILGEQKVTQLQIYVQELNDVPKPTVRTVTDPRTFSSPFTNSFGVVQVFDNPIKISPDPNAEILGRAQGIQALVSIDETTFHMSFDLIFTSGEYKGSTLNVVGNNPVSNEFQDLSIVGGFGVFKLARGFIGVKTLSFVLDKNPLYQYNVTVLHY